MEVINRYTILKEALAMAEHNLFCYSADWLQTRPKPSYEKEFEAEKKKAKLIKAMTTAL